MKSDDGRKPAKACKLRSLRDSVHHCHTWLWAFSTWPHTKNSPGSIHARHVDPGLLFWGCSPLFWGFQLLEPSSGCHFGPMWPPIVEASNKPSFRLACADCSYLVVFFFFRLWNSDKFTILKQPPLLSTNWNLGISEIALTALSPCRLSFPRV